MTRELEPFRVSWLARQDLRAIIQWNSALSGRLETEMATRDGQVR